MGWLIFLTTTVIACATLRPLAHWSVRKGRSRLSSFFSLIWFLLVGASTTWWLDASRLTQIGLEQDPLVVTVFTISTFYWAFELWHWFRRLNKSEADV